VAAADAAPARDAIQLATLSAHRYWMAAIGFSPDGRTLVGSSSLGRPSLVLWDVTDPSRPTRAATVAPRRSGSVGALAFSPDGQVLATVVGGYGVGMWDVGDPRRPARLTRFPAQCGALAMIKFSPAGRLLATGSWDLRKVRLWEVTDPARPVPLATISGSSARAYERPESRSPIAFNRDGTVLAAALWGEDVVLWDVADSAHPARLASLHVPDDVYTMAFSPDGHTLATAGRSVILWDVTDPAQPRAGATMYRGMDNVTEVAFSPDGRTLAVGGADPDVLLWDTSDMAFPVDTGLRFRSTGRVSDVEFSPDGRVLATTGRVHGDFSVVLWDLR
jgi:WD40 repeat protein